MAIEPTGPVSLPLENLRLLVAACPAFQAWAGDATAEAAKAHVHLVDLPPAEDAGGYTRAELAELMPLAVVDEFALDGDRPGGDAWSSDRNGLGAFVDSGKLLLRFEAAVPEEDANDPAAAKLKFYNAVGAVLQDMKGLGGGDADYLSIHRIVRYHPATRTPVESENAQGDVFRVSYVVFWGP